MKKDKENCSIFGYSFESILAKQQNKGNLELYKKSPAKSTNQNPQVACFGCRQAFRIPQTLGTNPWPVACSKCGHLHSEEDAKSAFWPKFL